MTHVIEEGYAKYTHMRDFFMEYANSSLEEYQRLWYKFSDKYGDIGMDLFLLDDEFMSRYGVNDSD